jgi:hypothetical protein
MFAFQSCNAIVCIGRFLCESRSDEFVPFCSRFNPNGNNASKYRTTIGPLLLRAVIYICCFVLIAIYVYALAINTYIRANDWTTVLLSVHVLTLLIGGVSDVLAVGGPNGLYSASKVGGDFLILNCFIAVPFAVVWFFSLLFASYTKFV